MKIAVIGSRELTIEDLGLYLPPDVDELVSGGARGIDYCAKLYAQKRNLKLRTIKDTGKLHRSKEIMRLLITPMR